MRNTASVSENETHKFLWDFDTQTDHLISARRPDLIIINKNRERVELRTLLSWLTTEQNWKKAKRWISTWTLQRNWKKQKNKKKNKKNKSVEHEKNGYTNCRWFSWYSHQKFDKRTRSIENKRSRGDNPNYTIVEIGQITENSPGDLRRLIFVHTPVKDHRLTLMWETFKK